MTLLEKKQTLKKAIDRLSDDQVDDVLLYLEHLQKRDTARVDYVESLLRTEKNLFDRLAQ